MIEAQSNLDRHSELMAKVKDFTLLNNVFMSVALNDVPACQHVVRILTGIPDLHVISVETQYRISKLTSHDAILDVLAEDSHGKLYNLEIQRRDTVDHARRTRFYAAMIDSELLLKGKEYNQLPEVHIIYISERDIWHLGKTCFSIQKFYGDSSIPYDDGLHVLFINTEINDGTAIAQLMQFFKTADPADMSQGALSQRVHQLKQERGNDTMYDVADDFIAFGREEEARKFVKKLAVKGMPLEEIAQLAEQSLETIQAWLAEESA